MSKKIRYGRWDLAVPRAKLLNKYETGEIAKQIRCPRAFDNCAQIDTFEYTNISPLGPPNGPGAVPAPGLILAIVPLLCVAVPKLWSFAFSFKLLSRTSHSKAENFSECCIGTLLQE